MTITSTPATRVTRLRLSTSQEVTAPRAAPRATKTSENPSTNRAARHHPAGPAVAPLLDVLAADPRHVGEVAGHQREHARRGERHEPGQHGHGQGDHDVPVDHDLLRPLGPAHLRHPLDQVGEQGGLLVGPVAGQGPEHPGRDPALGVHDEGVGRGRGAEGAQAGREHRRRSNSDG